MQLALGTFVCPHDLPADVRVFVMEGAVKVFRSCGVPGCSVPAEWQADLGGTVLPYCKAHLPEVARSAVGYGIPVMDVKRIAPEVYPLSVDVKEYTSVILAFRPDPKVARVLVDLYSGEGERLAPEDLHVTLCFLGEAEALASKRDQLLSAVEAIAETLSPLSVRVSGFTRFTNPPGGGDHAVVLALDSAELDDLRAELAATLEALGLQVGREHGFTPHITLAYVPPEQETRLNAPWDEPETLAFDRLWVFWGDEKFDFSLGSAGDKEAHWVTIDDRPVLIGGPPQGGGRVLGFDSPAKPVEMTPEERIRSLTPDGYTWEQVVEAAGYIGARREVPDWVDDIIDKAPVRGGATYGDWRDEVATLNYGKSLIDSAGDLLTDRDRDLVWEISELVGSGYPASRVVFESDEQLEAGIDWDSLEDEWGFNRYMLRPASGFIQGQLRPPSRDGENLFTIAINKDANNPRATFWHELSHALPHHIMERYAGQMAEGTLSGDWHNLFAEALLAAGEKEGRFVTLDDRRVVYIEGPGQGSGSATQTPRSRADYSAIPKDNLVQLDIPASGIVDAKARNADGVVSDIHVIMYNPVSRTMFVGGREFHATLYDRLARPEDHDGHGRGTYDDFVKLFMRNRATTGGRTEISLDMRRQYSLRGNDDEEIAVAYDQVFDTVAALLAVGYPPSTHFEYRVQPASLFRNDWITTTLGAMAAGKKEEGRFVTLQDLRGENYTVFIDGPGQGAGAVPEVGVVSVVAPPDGTGASEREARVAGLCRGMDDGQVAEVQEWLVDVPDRHLDGLRSISALNIGEALIADIEGDVRYVSPQEASEFVAPDLSVQMALFADSNGSLSESKDLYTGIVGMHLSSPGTRTRSEGHIILSERWGMRKAVLLHELGHHVLHKSYNAEWRDIQQLYDNILGQFRIGRGSAIPYEGMLKKILDETGLRTYSLTSSSELAADSYMVMLMGSDSQKFHLKAFWDSFVSSSRSIEELLDLKTSEGKALSGARKEGRFITLGEGDERRRVFIEGPGQGTGVPVGTVAFGGEAVGVPQGSPVSELFNLTGLPGERSKVGGAVRRTLAAIDSVHGDGSGRPLPVKQTSGRVITGGFWYNPTNNEPVRIEVSRNTDSPHLTFAHEAGHLMGHFIGKWYGDDHVVLEEFWSTVRSTGAVKRLEELIEMHVVQIPIDPDRPDMPETSIINYRVDREHLRYLLRRDELFARAYAQYIAVRSGDQSLLSELVASRLPSGQSLTRERLYPVQWDDDDFAPVALAMDNLFRLMRWISQ